MPSGPISSVQLSSVAQSCPTLCDPMNRSTPGLPVHHSKKKPATSKGVPSLLMVIAAMKVKDAYSLEGKL